MMSCSHCFYRSEPGLSEDGKFELMSFMEHIWLCPSCKHYFATFEHPVELIIFQHPEFFESV